MRLPPEIQFYKDAHLLVYRPHGLLNEASVNKVTSLIEDLEEKLKEPFDRFFDTVEHDDVELNFRYVINVSLYRRLSYAGHPPIKSAILATDSTTARSTEQQCCQQNHKCTRRTRDHAE